MIARSLTIGPALLLAGAALLVLTPLPAQEAPPPPAPLSLPKDVEVQAMQHNLAAQTMYRKMGFQQFGQGSVFRKE